jgi:hypothetical protein
MATRIYFSNISPHWPFERQKKLAEEKVPGFPDGVTIFQDDLSAGQRKVHQESDLKERAQLLRASTRKGGETIILPSLAVFDWTIAGMLACLTQAAARKAVVRVLDADLEIGIKPSPAVLNKAIAAFHKARDRDRRMEPGKKGGQISGGARAAQAKTIALKYKADWEASKKTSNAIAKESGLSVNTLKLYLGGRVEARRIYDAADKRRDNAWAKRGSAKGLND